MSKLKFTTTIKDPDILDGASAAVHTAASRWFEHGEYIAMEIELDTVTGAIAGRAFKVRR